MAKRKVAAKKAIRVAKEEVRSKASTGWHNTRLKSTKSDEQHESVVEIRVTSGAEKSRRAGQAKSFRVTRAGKEKNYVIQTGFGYFIPSLKKAENIVQVNQLVEAGILSKEVEPIIEYLDLKVPEIARAASVSPSTVSRWKGDSSIGVPGSNQFFRIDEVIRKGVDLFGGPEELKDWLHSPNLALGNVPAKLITSNIGVEMVDEALDALHYGNVM